jgi:hypothetical protein
LCALVGLEISSLAAQFSTLRQKDNIMTIVTILKHSFRRGAVNYSLIFRFSRGSWNLNQLRAADDPTFLREEESESVQRQQMKGSLEKELTGRLRVIMTSD